MSNNSSQVMVTVVGKAKGQEGVTTQPGEIGVSVHNGNIVLNRTEVVVEFTVINKIGVHLTGYNMQWVNSNNKEVIIELNNSCDIYLEGAYRIESTGWGCFQKRSILTETTEPKNTGKIEINIAPQQIVDKAITISEGAPVISKEYEKIHLAIIFKGMDENGKSIYEDYNDDQKIKTGIVLQFYQDTKSDTQ